MLPYSTIMMEEAAAVMVVKAMELAGMQELWNMTICDCMSRFMQTIQLQIHSLKDFIQQ
jgi:hypothetical protein